MTKTTSAPGHAPSDTADTAPCFALHEEGGIAQLVLSRPQAMNTMHPRFWRELDAHLQQLQQAGTARALVISSTGKHFSAGMDLQAFGGAITLDDRSPEGRAAVIDQLADMQTTFNRLEALRMPVLCAIQGGCVGGALDLVASACIRYASADAFFCVQEINIGMVADLGSLQRLPKLLPLGLVKELAYTGRRWPAAQAQAFGFVNAVLPTAEDALQAALQCAHEIAAKPPVAIWGTKQALHYARDHSVEDSLRQMGWLQSGIWSNRHVQEAVQAGQAKRAGDFPPLAPLRRFADLD